MMITAVLQFIIVFMSGSVAFLADTIHNFGDAATAIPLAIAFILARRKPSKTFSYGYCKCNKRKTSEEFAICFRHYYSCRSQHGSR
jgi:divalent metal cation (Fe/Co/Zn/Cd) transporter